MDVGVALPEFFFTQDRKMAPLMLLALVGGGILLPLAVASWHILSTKKYTGARPAPPCAGLCTRGP
jgi:translocation protein SEC63